MYIVVPSVLLHALSFIVPPTNSGFILKFLLTQKPLADFQTLVLSKVKPHHSPITSSLRFYVSASGGISFAQALQKIFICGDEALGEKGGKHLQNHHCLSAKD